MLYTDAVMRYRRALQVPLMVGELAIKLRQTYGGTYASLRRLEKQGLVKRAREKQATRAGMIPALFIWSGQ